MLKFIFKQYNVKYIGDFINVLYLTSPMLGMVSYAMSAVTMYAVVLPWAKTWFPWLTLPVFFIAGIILVFMAILSFFKFVLPGYLTFQNQQACKHKNPVIEKQEILEAKQDKMARNQKLIMDHLGIKEVD